MGDLAAAREAYGQALAIEPQWIGAFMGLAFLEEQADDLAAAGEALARASAVEPKSPAALFATALFHVRQGDRPRAAALLREAFELAPTNLQFGYAAALSRASNGDTDSAIEDLRALQEEFGPHAQVLLALATHLRDADRFIEATDVAQLLVAEHGAGYEPLLDELEQRSGSR